MPLLVADLLEPKGRIATHLFPGESEAALTARVTEYLAQGTAVATARGLVTTAADDFARLWSYHLAFDAAATRMEVTPASATRNDQGGMSYLGSQIDAVRARAEQFRVDAEAIATAAALPLVESVPSASVAVPVTYAW